MNKLVIAVILVVAVCSCHGISDRRSIRSASEFSAETNPIADNVAAPQDSEIVDQSISEFTGKKKPVSTIRLFYFYTRRCSSSIQRYHFWLGLRAPNSIQSFNTWSTTVSPRKVYPIIAILLIYLSSKPSPCSAYYVYCIRITNKQQNVKKKKYTLRNYYALWFCHAGFVSKLQAWNLKLKKQNVIAWSDFIFFCTQDTVITHLFTFWNILKLINKLWWCSNSYFCKNCFLTRTQ